MAITIRELQPSETHALPGLVHLLQDAVHGGASLGFLALLAEADARTYWEEVLAGLGPKLRMWVAEADGQIVGTIQYCPAWEADSRHRAELQKFIVLSAFRGQGLASQLMRTAEDAALADGRTLLTGDTTPGPEAEVIYRHLGWIRVGEVPDFAMSPTGELHPTVYLYKRIGP